MRKELINMNKIIGALVAFLLFLTASPSYAMIGVSPVIIDLDPQSKNIAASRTQDVRVYNHGGEIAYIKITPRIVDHPGTKHEKQIEVKNPQELGMLVSPRKLMIPPGQFKLVRFVFTKKPGKVDRIFRVDIQPVSGSLLLPKTKKEEVGIKLMVGYAVLVMQRPNNPMPKLSIKRDGRIVTVKNTGNTNVLLADGTQCENGSKKCVELETHRLYAGNTWTFKAPKALPVRFKGFYGDELTIVDSN
jgi:P pilus assembly chaperone PapD